MGYFNSSSVVEVDWGDFVLISTNWKKWYKFESKRKSDGIVVKKFQLRYWRSNVNELRNIKV